MTVRKHRIDGQKHRQTVTKTMYFALIPILPDVHYPRAFSTRWEINCGEKAEKTTVFSAKNWKPYKNCKLQYLQRITFITYICIDISNTSCDKCQNALKKIWPLNCPTDYRMIRDVILVSLGGKRRKKVGRLPEKSMNDDITLAKRF
jgi:hypothetical protein